MKVKMLDWFDQRRTLHVLYSREHDYWYVERDYSGRRTIHGRQDLAERSATRRARKENGNVAVHDEHGCIVARYCFGRVRS